MIKHKFKLLLFVLVFMFVPLTVSGQASCSLIEDRPYLIQGTNSVVYVTDDCTKQKIRNPEVYFSHFDSWDRLNGVTQNRINQISDDSVEYLPIGPRAQIKRPALVKVPDERSVYLVVDRVKYRFTSENSFRRLGYNFGQVVDVDERLLDQYLYAGRLNSSSDHPARAMIRYRGEDTVYKIGPNNRKLPISDPDILGLQGFNSGSVAVVTRSSFQYRNGLTYPREVTYSEQRSESIARNWVRQESPTFRFDGQDLELEESLAVDTVDCEDCYQFVFSFESIHEGYGDRTDENVAQVITPHEMVVTVEHGVVTKAITDEEFNEITGEFVDDSQ